MNICILRILFGAQNKSYLLSLRKWNNKKCEQEHNIIKLKKWTTRTCEY